MKKTLFKFWIIILSCFMVLSNASLLAYSEDISDNEKNDIANSFRYTDGETREGHSMSLFLRSAVDSSWPQDSKAIAKGIDVSTHNEKIDWRRVKQSGVDYAIIRCGYGTNETSQDDKRWEENVKGCVENNIPYGVYLYSYADTVAKASSEADHAIRLLQGKKLSYPVYYDLEEYAVRNKVSKTGIGDIAETFCNKLSAKGYTVGIYASKDWFTNYLTDSRFSSWTKWVAQYNSTCTYTGTYDMWQCSSTGSVPGISGRVDLNYAYKTFNGPSNVNKPQYSDGLHQVNGGLYYYTNNQINKSYNGIASYNGNDYLVVNGKVDTSKTGFTQAGVNWYMLNAGKVNKNFTDLYYYNKNWFYINKGVLDWSFNCPVPYNNNIYYVEGSMIRWNHQGLVESNGTLYYVSNSMVDYNYDGLYKQDGKYYYIKKGVVDYSHSGLIYYTNEWFYVDHGVINWDCCSLVLYDKRWYYVDHGKINWGYTDLVKYGETWYYVRNGEVDWNFTDVVYYYGTWYYVKKGKLDWNHTGLFQHSGTWYYVRDGRINYSYKGLVYHSGNYFYVENGEINWNFNGYAQVNNKGTYYKEVNGKRV